MKRTLFTLLLFIVCFMPIRLWAQEIAVTERGDTVFLYANGTWSYYNEGMQTGQSTIEIRMNDQPHTKPEKSIKKISGLNDAYEVWYDEKKWKRVPPGELNPEADIALKFMDGDAYAMVIYEEVEIPAANLSQIAIDNAANVAPDIKMIDREYRVVNNDTLVWMRMDGTANGIKIAYYSYYFSNTKGAIQFHTFTGQNLMDKYKEELENLLDGLIIPK
ncbi:MAG: hypothetical protein SF052_08150 [Bacteroidia bacterium]|nr:hypothetical protein [Bacteroidia bacterium]